MHHLDKVARARWAAMQVTLLRGAANFFAPRSTRSVTATRGKRLEDGVEALYNFIFSADHLAIAAFQAPNAAAGSHVNVVQAFGREFFCAANVVNVIGIAAVDHDIAGLKLRA